MAKSKKNTITKTTNASKRKKLAVPRNVADTDTRRYWLALTDPFSPDAVGARVPDMYSAHTATYTVRASHTLSNNAGGAASLFVFPNIVASAYLAQGTSPDFVSITWGDNTSTTNARWGLDPNALGAKLDNYRIVGMGLRVTNLSSMTNSQGKFFMGTYPCNSSWHTKDYPVAGNTLPTNASYTPAVTTSDWGVPLIGTSATVANNLLVQYPGCEVRSALEMAEEVYDIVPRPVDPRAFQFRTTNGQLNGWETVGAAAGGAVVTGSADYLDLSGFEAAFVSLVGAPNSVGASSFDVEVVYHIEGRPYLAGISSATAQNELITPAASSPSPNNPLGFFEAVSAAVKIPAVREVVNHGATLINPMLGRIVRGI